MNCTRTGANGSEFALRTSVLSCIPARLARLNGRQARVDLSARLGRAFEIGPVALVVVGGHKPLEMREGGLKAADAVEDGRAVRPRDVGPPAAASAVRLSGDETAMSMSAKAIMWGTWETIA